MSGRDLAVGLLDALDDDALSLLAERLRPHLAEPGGMVDAKEAAARLGLHERTVARMAREGRIPGAVKVGRSWRFRADRLAPRAPIRLAEAASPRRGRREAHRPSVAAIRNAG